VKRIIVSIIMLASLQLTASTTAPMIINRANQAITVNFMNGTNPLFSTGAITLAGDPTHASDQMVLIPSTSIVKPGSSPAANYQNSATSATVMVGTVSVTVPCAAGMSYVIAPGATAGTFVANAGAATYNSSTGAATYGTPSPAGAGTGF